MIELRYVDAFPVAEIMTTLATLAEATLVLILVAGNACCRCPKKCLVQLLNSDERASRWRNMLGCVTAITRETGMFAFQRVSGLTVVKRVTVPLHDGKVFAVMLGVAADTVFAHAWRDVVRGM